MVSPNPQEEGRRPVNVKSKGKGEGRCKGNFQGGLAGAGGNEQRTEPSDEGGGGKQGGGGGGVEKVEDREGPGVRRGTLSGGFGDKVQT